ncbi:hypothetical protein F5878DRAFT_617942 [Lentinula raphanica]|uniref:Uncharacterized protein n=1 Tax=Lentinula raphanica TaxID=153919 RepID=A0AA38P9U1_9AGAR|nr:hypothetical protein F5878DRAFT_617942 [Lentinula raphanica]
MGKNNFYVVTVGKDVGVFNKWLQVSQVRSGTNCEGYDTKEDAIKAFDEAYANGFVQIIGSFKQPYQSPRIYPPLDCPPYSCGPTSVVVPISPPSTPTRARKYSLTSPVFLPPSSVQPSPARVSSPTRPTSTTVPANTPATVTMRSSQSLVENAAPRTHSRVTEVRSPTEGGCTYCGCACAGNSSHGHHRKSASTSSSGSKRSSSAKGKQPVREYEVSVISSESESESEHGPPSSSRAPITPRRTRTVNVHSAHRASPVGARPILRPLSTSSSNNKSSPLPPPRFQYANPSTNNSPSRVQPSVVIDISDDDSYPSDPTPTDTDDSSGPEDVTPARTTRLLSPLTSPVFDLDTALVEAMNETHLRSTPPSSLPPTPRKRDAGYRKFLVPSAGEVRVLGLHQSPAVFNESVDPRSPMSRDRTVALDGQNSMSFGRPTPDTSSRYLGSPGKFTLFA